MNPVAALITDLHPFLVGDEFRLLCMFQLMYAITVVYMYVPFCAYVTRGNSGDKFGG